ncbi:dTDP-4-dehydrorhamnose reductase [Gordonia crocea]|uniref:dTDP-4-dehydrorhamnose reductase n=1 Tax=Gordonia crocea TaxID=589162 RepID=A0A7I9UX63_9ACTN|nr:dTDP-4-dehydrorhamnose reductase [Gordonia crocea]GED97390.1 NAD(P)-dependent oxidoreductase [Gordonia crocea]
MTVFVTGSGGQLGRALASTRPDGLGIIGLTSADLDISDAAAVAAWGSRLTGNDVVLNCAAYTRVDDAQREPERAAAVNATGPALLAAQTASAGARLIHLSTDYVFDGPAAPEPPTRTTPYEPDETGGEPPSVYGRTKLDGERRLREADPSATVVRTSWLYTGGTDDVDFVSTMRRLAGERDRLTVVDDQHGSPTYAPDLARGLWEMVVTDAGRAATVHAANGGETTWCGLAKAVFEELGLDATRVEPCSTADFPRPAPRPAYSVLSTRSWRDLRLTPLRQWRDAVGEALVR